MNKYKRWWGGLIALGLLWLLAGPGRAMAHAQYDHSNPAANATLPAGQPPSQVEVWFSERIEPKFSKLSVLDKDGKAVDRADSHVPPGEDAALIVSLPTGLPDGAYTVIFENVSADDGHHVKSSFSFAVGDAPLPVGSAVSLIDNLATPETDANFNPWSVTLRWLNYLAMAALVGLIIFWRLVWQPAWRQAHLRLDTETGNEADRRLSGRVVSLLAVSLGLLTAGWLGWLIYQAGVVGNSAPWQVFEGDTLPNLLFSTRFGLTWLARLGLIGLGWLGWGWLRRATTGSGPVENGNSLATLEPPASGHVDGAVAVRQATTADVATVTKARPLVGKVWAGLLAVGLAIMLTTSLNSHAAASKTAWLLVPNDWLHLVSMGVWVGGLSGLSLALPVSLRVLKAGSGDRTRLLAALIPRFSRLALLAVIVLLLTGTLQAIVQLGSFEALFNTAYGVALLVKLGLFLLLIGLGAFNLRIVSPRLTRFARYRPTNDKPSEDERGAGSLTAGRWQRYFRRSTRLEIGLMAVTLLVAASLTSLAPPQTGGPANLLVERGQAGNLSYILAISPAQLGENNFELDLKDTATNEPISLPRTVVLRLTMLDMAMGAPQETAFKPVVGKPGRYTTAGLILSMNGRWEAVLFVQQEGQADVNVPIYFQIKE